MSRIEFTTLERPIRQVGSMRYAELDGMQNLCYRCTVEHDDTDVFTAPLAKQRGDNFDRKVIFLIEKTEQQDHEQKPLLIVTDTGRSVLDCAAFVFVSPSFLQYSVTQQRPLKLRMLFADDRNAWWPKSDDTTASPKRTTRSTRFHVVAA